MNIPSDHRKSAAAGLTTLDDTACKRTRSHRWVVSMLGALVSATATACVIPHQTVHSDIEEIATPAPYAPYEFLIGEWDIGVEGSPPAAVTRFQWGPKKTYIWVSGSLLIDQVEQPTYEGVLVWNAVRKNLDMLITLELSAGGLVQEQGEVFVEADGTVVRDITVFYSQGEALPPNWDRRAGPDGATAHFRHSFKSVGPDEVSSAVVRETADGWVPSFPGSERLVMTRRPRR